MIMNILNKEILGQADKREHSQVRCNCAKGFIF